MELHKHSGGRAEQDFDVADVDVAGQIRRALPLHLV